MPYRKDYLSSGQTEKILDDTSRQMCTDCYHREICWGEHGESLLKGGKAMIRALEEGDMEKAEDIRLQWAQLCGKSAQYLETVKDRFQKEKQVLIWDNRMIESRLAVAQQLNETARIMEKVAEDLYDIIPADLEFQEEIRKALKKRLLWCNMYGQWTGQKDGVRSFDHAGKKRSVCIGNGSISDLVGSL